MPCAVSTSMSSRRTNRHSTAPRKASVSVVTSCSGDGYEAAVGPEPAIGHQQVQMRVPVRVATVGLDG